MPRELSPCGTIAAYQRGCRCTECRAANTDNHKRYRARYKAQHGHRLPSQTVRANRPAPRRATCVDCGKLLRRCLADVPRCRPCFLVERERLRRAASKRRAATRRLAVAAAGTSSTWVWTTGECAGCLTYFVRHGQTSRFCSTACSRRARRSWKIALRDRLAIYERDVWQCQLCMEPVDRDLMSVDPANDWAPSLDHIEPQSWALIPDHSPTNLRLAHRWCNSVRGDLTYYGDSDLRVA